jgi:hypothetical protein
MYQTTRPTSQNSHLQFVAWTAIYRLWPYQCVNICRPCGDQATAGSSAFFTSVVIQELPVNALTKFPSEDCQWAMYRDLLSSSPWSLSCCRQVAMLWCVHLAIPVGIAVARQRLQDHGVPPSGTKPDVKPPQAPPCRQQKALAPAPPEPQCSSAELVAAAAPPSLSAMGKWNATYVY